MHGRKTEKRTTLRRRKHPSREATGFEKSCRTKLTLKTNIMYVPNHLKWRILLAQELKLHYFERENSHRNCKRIFELYGRYLLGTTYDTFLNYLNQLKYEIGNLRLPPYIEAAIGLLEPLRIANERLRIRKLNGTWTLQEMVEEVLHILQEQPQQFLNQRIACPDTRTDCKLTRDEFGQQYRHSIH